MIKNTDNTFTKEKIDMYIQSNIMRLNSRKKIIEMFEVHSREMFLKTKNKLMKSLDEDIPNFRPCQMTVPNYNFGKYPLYSRANIFIDPKFIIPKNISNVTNIRTYSKELKILTDNQIQKFKDIDNMGSLLHMVDKVDIYNVSDLRANLNKFVYPMDCKYTITLIDSMIQELNLFYNLEYFTQLNIVNAKNTHDDDLKGKDELATAYYTYAKICTYYNKLVDLLFNIIAVKFNIIDLGTTKIINKPINESEDIHLASSLMLLEGNLEQAIEQRQEECCLLDEILDDLLNKVEDINVKTNDILDTMYSEFDKKDAQKESRRLMYEIKDFKKTLIPSKEARIIPIINRQITSVGVYKDEIEQMCNCEITTNKLDSLIHNINFLDEDTHEDRLLEITSSVDRLVDFVNKRI